MQLSQGHLASASNAFYAVDPTLDPTIDSGVCEQLRDLASIQANSIGARQLALNQARMQGIEVGKVHRGNHNQFMGVEYKKLYVVAPLRRMLMCLALLTFSSVYVKDCFAASSVAGMLAYQMVLAFKPLAKVLAALPQAFPHKQEAKAPKPSREEEDAVHTSIQDFVMRSYVLTNCTLQFVDKFNGSIMAWFENPCVGLLDKRVAGGDHVWTLPLLSQAPDKLHCWQRNGDPKGFRTKEHYNAWLQAQPKEMKFANIKMVRSGQGYIALVSHMFKIVMTLGHHWELQKKRWRPHKSSALVLIQRIKTFLLHEKVEGALERVGAIFSLLSNYLRETRVPPLWNHPCSFMRRRRGLLA